MVFRSVVFLVDADAGWWCGLSAAGELLDRGRRLAGLTIPEKENHEQVLEPDMITDSELQFLTEQIEKLETRGYDEERFGEYSVHVENNGDLILTSMFEFEDEDEEVVRDVTARWKLTLLDTAAEDYD